MQNYVLGFLVNQIDEDLKSILLVKKQKGPPINHGKWNGVGGKIEERESPFDAMKREFFEETKILIRRIQWSSLGIFSGKEFKLNIMVHFSENADFITPDENDVGEKLQWFDFNIYDGFPSVEYAQNVPTMISHILTGQGPLKLQV